MSHVPWFVCVLGTPESPAKTDEPIEIPFWGRFVWASVLDEVFIDTTGQIQFSERSVLDGDTALCHVTLTTVVGNWLNEYNRPLDLQLQQLLPLDGCSSNP